MSETIRWSDFFECTSIWSETIVTALESHQRWNVARNSLLKGLIGRTFFWSGVTFERMITHHKSECFFESSMVWSEFTLVSIWFMRDFFCMQLSTQRRCRPGPQLGHGFISLRAWTRTVLLLVILHCWLVMCNRTKNINYRKEIHTIFFKFKQTVFEIWKNCR